MPWPAAVIPNPISVTKPRRSSGTPCGSSRSCEFGPEGIFVGTQFHEATRPGKFGSAVSEIFDSREHASQTGNDSGSVPVVLTLVTGAVVGSRTSNSGYYNSHLPIRWQAAKSDRSGGDFYGFSWRWWPAERFVQASWLGKDKQPAVTTLTSPCELTREDPLCG